MPLTGVHGISEFSLFELCVICSSWWSFIVVRRKQNRITISVHENKTYHIRIFLFHFEKNDVSSVFFFFFLCFGLGVRLRWVHLVRRMINDECGTVGGMRIGRGKPSTRRKPTLVQLCPPQIPHDLTWARTRAAAVGCRRLTAWAMARTKWAGSSESIS
jgi:hypothetical protein